MRRYIALDPHNTRLLTEAAEAAFDAGLHDEALGFVHKLRASTKLSKEQQNLSALIMLSAGHHAEAEALLVSLRDAGERGPSLRFNLAWALAMQEKFEEALELLDDEVMSVSPRAPSLRVQMLHHLGRLDEGLRIGRQLVERFGDNTKLYASLAVLSMDADDRDAARAFAGRSGDDPDGRAVAAMIALNDGAYDSAHRSFDRVLAIRPDHPRAWVGKGLSLLAAGDAKQGASAIRRGAELFKDHVGSWVAAGWAAYLSGDLDRARRDFERGLTIDPNFAELHGGLAVLDLALGDRDAARKRADIAMRLDRNSFGAALARSMMMERSGDTDGARRLLGRALATPTGADGATLIDALTRFGISHR